MKVNFKTISKVLVSVSLYTVAMFLMNEEFWKEILIAALIIVGVNIQGIETRKQKEREE